MSIFTIYGFKTAFCPHGRSSLSLPRSKVFYFVFVSAFVFVFVDVVVLFFFVVVAVIFFFVVVVVVVVVVVITIDASDRETRRVRQFKQHLCIPLQLL